MAPSEAEQLNVEQARFYLSDSKTVQAYCQRVNRRCREAAGRPVKKREEILKDMRTHLQTLRDYYTGKSDG